MMAPFRPHMRRSFSTIPRKSHWLSELGRLAGFGTLEPRVLPTSGFELINPSTKVEEEALPYYRPERYYPVQLGEVFENRYQVISKLEFGSSSTTWLGHDLRYVFF